MMKAFLAPKWTVYDNFPNKIANKAEIDCLFGVCFFDFSAEKQHEHEHERKQQVPMMKAMCREQTSVLIN